MTRIAELYAAHHGEVRALARRLVGNPEEADDVTAATFEVLPRALARYQGTSSPRSFVLGVCANLARQARRATARRREVMELLGAAPAPGVEDPETEAARRELIERLATALGALSDAHRTTFLLACVEDRPLAEIAARCGVPEATVRTRLHYARRQLREALAPDARRGGGAGSTLFVVLCCAVLAAGSARAAGVDLVALGHRVLRAAGLVHTAPATTPRAAPAARLPRVEPAAQRPAIGQPVQTAPRATAADAQPGTPPAVSAPRATSGALDPRYVRAHRAHFHDGDFAAAVRAWDAYLARSPRGRFALEARYNRALALARLARLAEARAALEPFAAGRYGPYRRAEAQLLLGVLPR